MVFSNAERRALGYEVVVILNGGSHAPLKKEGRMDEVIGSGPVGETFSELYDRIGGIVADALEKEIATQPV